ncbi:MAG: hypothetical protein CSA53_02880 [Gammaproteobacteria bacterium]|nr:MAG: hypothetical protein CSA53_02880 [Gammaproteobacteria bacterium]
MLGRLFQHQLTVLQGVLNQAVTIREAVSDLLLHAGDSAHCGNIAAIYCFINDLDWLLYER